jgi:hypothetical protein
VSDGVTITVKLPSFIQVPANQSTVTKSYPPECQWTFNKDGGGYPLVAFKNSLADYICPSAFRDMSDYVFGWPFSHFGEEVYVLDKKKVPPHLPPVSASMSTSPSDWILYSVWRSSHVEMLVVTEDRQIPYIL